MKNLPNYLKAFLEYSFKGNGKYYITECGSRHFRNTTFYTFYNRNRDCVNVISEGNDAPRGGRVGDYMIVEFNEKFELLNVGAPEISNMIYSL